MLGTTSFSFLSSLRHIEQELADPTSLELSSVSCFTTVIGSLVDQVKIICDVSTEGLN